MTVHCPACPLSSKGTMCPCARWLRALECGPGQFDCDRQLRRRRHRPFKPTEVIVPLLLGGGLGVDCDAGPEAADCGTPRK
jgi:hypothetical protein